MVRSGRNPASAALTARLLGGFGSAGVLLATFAFAPEASPQGGVCLFHRLTALPCPGCGLSRALCAISHGQFHRAWLFNPFGFVFYGALIAILFVSAFYPRLPRDRTRRVALLLAKTALPVLLLAMLAFDVWRIMGGG